MKPEGAVVADYRMSALVMALRGLLCQAGK